MGEKEKAIELIQRDYEGHADWLPNLLIDPLFDSIRFDSRILDILKKIGLRA